MSSFPLISLRVRHAVAILAAFSALLTCLGLIEFRGGFILFLMWPIWLLSFQHLIAWWLPGVRWFSGALLGVIFVLGLVVGGPAVLIFYHWDTYTVSPRSSTLVRCEVQRLETTGSSNGLFRYSEYVPLFWKVGLALNQRDINYAWVSDGELTDLQNPDWIFPQIAALKQEYAQGTNLHQRVEEDNGRGDRHTGNAAWGNSFNELAYSGLLFSVFGDHFTVPVDCP